MTLTGNIQNTVAETEHAWVNGVAVKKVTLVDAFGNLVNASPTAQTNASVKISKNAAGQLVKVEKTINGTTYTKTTDVTDQTITSAITYSQWV